MNIVGNIIIFIVIFIDAQIVITWRLLIFLAAVFVFAVTITGFLNTWCSPANVCQEFVCLGLTLLLNTWGHITRVPACSSDTLTNVLPHRNAMPQTQDMTPHPVTVYRHRADLLVCYPLMRNVKLEYTATHFNVLGLTRYVKNLPWPSKHTSERSTLWCCHAGSQWEPGTCGVRIHHTIRSPTAASCMSREKTGSFEIHWYVHTICFLIQFQHFTAT